MFSQRHLFAVIVTSQLQILLSHPIQENVLNNLILDYGAKMFGSPNEKVGDIINDYSPKTNLANPEELSGYLEGDILINRKSKNGLVDFGSKWDAGIIPYVITGPFSEGDLNMIYEAMRQYHENTCIRFRRRQPEDVDYINIINTRTGCWSSVGKIGGMQEVNLQSPGCLGTLGTPVHELMHAVGFNHEQTRYERDNFVDIKWENIQNGHDFNFAKVPKEIAVGYGIPYDYNSVMHYSAYAFSANQKPTIVPKRSNVRIGQRDGFSVGDIRKIRNMYNCTTMMDQGKPNTNNSNNKNPIMNLLGQFQNLLTSFG
ncbi:zinc metalloproteinase nas-4-like [Onthophagus taurus]|uniref:zinc metalloproteinase nas-4-like n=1 Tax=Onthophagus taurus TaxID=166361 RepID=UPI0039BE875C